MFTLQKGNIVFECDTCGETLETEQADFHSALNMAKRQGWRTRKFEEVWAHACPNCNHNPEK
jgi:predicted RNA-binding Zn-ribbon protein involved in translation (DUF1610 family)